jgi:hypothetical protein
MAEQLAHDLFKVAHGDRVELISDRKVIHVLAATLEGYEGYYEFRDGDVMRGWRDGDRFLTQLQAEPAVEIFPQSEHEFFAKVVDAQITFKEHGGPAAEFVLHQNGKDHSAKRLEEARQTEIRRTRRADQESNASTRHRERAAWAYR